MRNCFRREEPSELIDADDDVLVNTRSLGKSLDEVEAHHV